MGLALLVIIWLITFISTYFFAAKTWWLPHGVATAAPWIDHQFALTYVLMGIVFLAAQCGLGWLVWRHGEGASSAPVEYSHGNTTLELAWTTLTAILFIGLNLMGSHVWASERFEPAKPGSVPVEVTGMQFAWYFRYPGPDGKFGRTNPKLMDPSAVAFGGSTLRRWSEVHPGPALLRELEPQLAARLRFAIERPGYRRRPTHVGKKQNLNFEIAALGSDLQKLPDPNFPRRFDRLAVSLNSAEFTSSGGQAACLEESGGPKPLVYANIGHDLP
jgi:heme/copper-type cytochrome/quinol oxidase subunit 2